MLPRRSVRSATVHPRFVSLLFRDAKRKAVPNGFCRKETAGALPLSLLPRPVLRERVGVRVQSQRDRLKNDYRSASNPHPASPGVPGEVKMRAPDPPGFCPKDVFAHSVTTDKTMTDDQALIEYAHSGSPDAFRELADRYVDLVYSSAKRQLGDAHSA